jgi:hypothetical protein
MLKFDSFSATQDFVRNAALDRDRHLVQLLTTMTERIVKLEEQLDKLNDLTAGGLLDPFDERVLQVLDVRSGTAREALGLDDADVERWILATIEENSGTAFSHIEAEIEEKIDGLLEGNSFHEAVTDAVQGSLHGIVEEILDGILADAITDHLGDAEDIVRKGLRSIL